MVFLMDLWTRFLILGMLNRMGPTLKNRTKMFVYFYIGMLYVLLSISLGLLTW